MNASEASHYTITCLFVGFGLGLVFYFFMGDAANAIIDTSFKYLSITQPDFSKSRVSGIGIFLTTGFYYAICVVSLLILRASFELDFFDKNDNSVTVIIFGIATILFIMFIITSIFSIFQYFNNRYGNPDWIAFITETEGFFRILFGFIMSIIGGIFFLIIALCSFAVMFFLPPVAFGLAFGAVLCLPRALIYATTTHRLRRAVDEAAGPGMISAKGVAAGLGQRSFSAAHSVALRKDLSARLAAARAVDARLKAEEECLSKAMYHDTKRLEDETELLKVLEKIDTRKLRIKTLKAAKGKQAR